MTARFEKVSEVVARQILDDIVARKLPPGTLLPSESAMLEEMQVGRGSLREALRILEVLGLIRVKAGPHGGPVVAEVTSREFGRTSSFFYHARNATLGNLLEARTLTEPMMARLAAQRLTPEIERRLQENLQATRDLIDDPGPEWARVSGEFHGLIAGASGNPILDLVGSSLNDIHSARVSPLFPVGARKPVLKTHEQIAQAIMTGDADGAESMASKHMDSLCRHVQKLGLGLVDGPLGWR